MKYVHKILMFSACLVSLAASAQWQWTDKDGRKVFSDRAPPADIQEKNITKRPAGRATPPAPAAPALNAASPAPTVATASAPQGPASVPKLSGVDKELLEKKKKAEDVELAKRRAEEERIVKAKVENCARAKQAKISLSSGTRIYRTNEKGERVILDDAAMAAEAQRVQSIIDSDCK